jgi:hypothetical protein
MLSWILSAVTIDSKHNSEITYLKSNKLPHDTQIWKKDVISNMNFTIRKTDLSNMLRMHSS